MGSKQIQIKVTGRELYDYCTDFGLMLSWGIPLLKVLNELKKNNDNTFLQDVSSLVVQNVLRGESIASSYGKFPGIFKPAFTKWIRIGERFGLLDEALLKIAGLIRFNTLLTGEKPEVSAKEAGDFLLKAAEIIRNKEYYKTTEDECSISPSIYEELKKLSSSKITDNWIDLCEKGEKPRLFDISMMEYLTVPVYSRIAAASFWHILGSAEVGGYLPDMMEIIGLYLKNPSNLLPENDLIETEEQLLRPERDLDSMAMKLLETAEQYGKLAIEIDNSVFSLILGEKKMNMGEYLDIDPHDRSELFAVVNTLKFLLYLDPAERRIPQGCRKEINIGGRTEAVKVHISPPFPFASGLPRVKIPPEKEEPEIIEITLENRQNEN